MTIAVALLLILLAFAAYRLTEDYLRRSMRSFANADRVGVRMKLAAEELLGEDIPASVAAAVIGLVYIAGCGCFVRGILIGHYFPRFRASSASPRVQQAFDDLDNLPAAHRQKFYDLLGAVIAYDSFRNPLQGWLFRRIAKSYFEGSARMGVVEKADATATVFSVLSRKASHA